jgi:hypothetical protein
MPKLREVNGRKNGPKKKPIQTNTWVCGPGYVEKPRRRLHAFTCVMGEGDKATVLLLPQYDISALPEGSIEAAAKVPLLRHPNHGEIVKPLRDEAIGKRVLLKDGFAVALDAECSVALRRLGAKFVGFFRHDTVAPSTKKAEYGLQAPTPSMHYPELCTA